MTRPAGTATLAVALALLSGPLAGPAAAQDAATARASAYAVRISGPVSISERPTAVSTASAGEPAPSPVEQVLLNIPAQPVLGSGTFRASAGTALHAGLTATLQSVMRRASPSVPVANNARAYAVVENLAALPGGILSVDAVEAEAVARCTSSGVAFATAGRVTDIRLVGATLPAVITPTPNQVLLDNPLLGIRIVLWETNWDPATGRTTDGSDTVFVNAMRVTQSLLGIDLVTSHAEATGRCGGAAGGPTQDEVLPTVLPRTGAGAAPLAGLALLLAGSVVLLVRRTLLRRP